MSLERTNLAGCPMAVVGGGLMGRAIAVHYARAGHRVHLVDIDPAARAAAEALEVPGLRVLADLDAGVETVDLVIESVPEDLRLKQQILAELDRVCGGDVVIASNSSSFVPSLLGRDVASPSRLLGVHYFNPPDLVPLVEVVPGPRTDPHVLNAMSALLHGHGHVVVQLHHEIPGLVANRLQAALLREALSLVDHGVASVADIDRVITAGLGRRWSAAGVFQICDLGGLGVWHVLATQLFSQLESSGAVSERLAVAHQGGSGFYGYSPESLQRLRADVAERLSALLLATDEPESPGI